MTARYSFTAPTTAQQRCPHRLRNKAETECSTCGSVRDGNRWKYLNAAWFAYYTSDNVQVPA